MQQRFWPDSQPLIERLGRDFFRQIPKSPGVYLMHGMADVVLYVGKAKSLRHRLGTYRVANPDRMKRRTLRLLRLVQRIVWEECLDEPTALARESELLRSLKPKFNRAGVWQGQPDYLIWRRRNSKLEFKVAEAPAADWEPVGLCGRGMRFFRASLVRLLWYAINNPASCTAMPEGWLHGRLGRIAALTDNRSPNLPSKSLESILSKLFQGDADGFVAWIGERTKSLVRSYDLEIREADLETITKFFQTKNPRTTSPETTQYDMPNKSKEIATAPLFPDEIWASFE